MRALAPGGVLSVTLWNKEEPPKVGAEALYDDGRRGARGRPGDRMAQFLFRRLAPISRRRRCSTRAAASRQDEDQDAARSIRTPCRSTRSIRRASSTIRRRQRPHAAGYGAILGQRRSTGRPSASPAQAAEADERAARSGATPRPASGQGRRRRAARDSHGPARLACAASSGQWPRDRQVATSSTRRRSPTTHPYFAAYVKTADLPRVLDPTGRAAAGRVGLSAHLGDARRRLPDGGGAARDPALFGAGGLDLLAIAGQGADRALFRLSRRRLHHGRGRAHRPFRHGARQSDDLGVGPHYRDAGVLRPRRAGLRARPAA